MMLKGVDISRWNEVSNWKKVKEAGLDWISIKISQGNNIVDAKAASHVAGARSVGIPIMPYHYLWPNMSAASQWAKFEEGIEVVGGWDGMIVPTVDVEGDAKNQIGNMTSEAYVKLAKDWLDLLEAENGVKGVVYTYPYFNTQHKVGKSLGSYPLWAASYKDDAPVKFTGWSTWTFWQYSDHGSWPGFGGGLDMDYFNGTLDDLKKLFIVKPEIPAIKIVSYDGSVIQCEPKWDKDMEGNDRITVKAAPLLKALGLPTTNPVVHKSGRAYLYELQQYLSPWQLFYRVTSSGPRVYIKKITSNVKASFVN